MPLVEATGGLLFAFAASRYGMSLDAVLVAAAFSFLLLNKVLLAALPFAAAAAVLWSSDLREPVWTVGNRLTSLALDALAAGGLGLVIFLVFALLSRGGMGGGDVKLAGVIGIWVGLQALAASLMVAVLLGGIVAILLLVSRSLQRKDAMPFAPFLCAGGAVGLVWGADIGSWYVGVIT